MMHLPPYIPQITLETQRLRLPEITPEIINYVFTQWRDEDIMSYLGLQTAEQLAAEKEKQQGGYTTYRIKLKGFSLISKDINQVIGAAYFHTWLPMHARAEIGYVMYREDCKNKGYMKEALSAIIAYGFEKMDLNRIEAFVSPSNEPSLRLVKNMGFVKEGLLRENYYVNGVAEDSILFSLLRKDFMAQAE